MMNERLNFGVYFYGAAQDSIDTHGYTQRNIIED